MVDIVDLVGQQGRPEMQKTHQNQNFLEFDLSMHSIMHVDLTIGDVNEMMVALKTRIGSSPMQQMLSPMTQKSPKKPGSQHD
jgi:hypothetical protein